MKGEYCHDRFKFSSRVLVVVFFAIVHTTFSALKADAQHRRHRHTEATPSDTSAVAKRASKAPSPPKQDRLTLRYKPQAGTLLYDVRTDISQHIRTDRDELSGTLTSQAQLAFHNVSIDYKKGLWSFDQYFTRFQIAGRQLSGDTLSLNENRAVNKITRLTYEMMGHELAKEVIDSLKLFNAEAQTNSYFIQPPRMLIPLPEKSVTYGDIWFEHRLDTIQVLDTINIGVTTGAYIYDVYRTYYFDKLVDSARTVDSNAYLAQIVAKDSGTFEGYQSNTVTNVTQKSRGPISGADTTYLDLFSGRVVMRTLRMTIPATVTVSSAVPFTDFLDVRSVVSLSTSNAMRIER